MESNKKKERKILNFIIFVVTLYFFKESRRQGEQGDKE